MKKIFITGTSRGLGKALAENYLSKGHEVVGYSRTCSIEHACYTHHAIDLSDTKQVEKIQFDLSGNFTSYILINNAGSLGHITYLGKLNTQSIIDAFNINTLAPIILMNQFISAGCNKKAQKFVLNIGTGAASNAIDGWSVYCSSKASINMLSEVYAAEQVHGKNNCKVVTLAPGIIDTAMQEKIRAAKKEDFSNVARFTFYKNNAELISPKTAAEKIIINFENIYNKNTPIQSLRDY